MPLDLEGLVLSPTTSTLELGTLASDIGFLNSQHTPPTHIHTGKKRRSSTNLVLVRTKAKVLDRLASILRTTEQEGVSSGRRAEGELVQSQDLTTSLLNPGPSSRREAEGSDGQFGDGEETVVVGDGADDDDGLALVRIGGVGDDAGQRDGGTVDSGHKQTAQNDLVEVGIGTACCGSHQHPFFIYIPLPLIFDLDF